MLNYLKKFALDILPSVAATIIGAYIVQHYIAGKPGTDAPVAAAVSAADPKAADAKAAAKPEVKTASLPAAGVKAKGISEKSIMEKTAAEQPAVVEKAQEVKADVKPVEAPAETASISADQHRHAVPPREKEKVRVILPSPVQPVTSAVTPAVVPAPVVVAPPPVEAAAAPAPEEHRDANDLARAAIERLRGNGEARVATAPASAAPAVRPLPPPIMVSAPPAEPFGQGSQQPRPPFAPSAAANDPNRPTPPADIPVSRPLDLRAEVAEPSVRERTQAAAEDVLSTAKSLFHSVLPK